jgi:hypothetical protein
LLRLLLRPRLLLLLLLLVLLLLPLLREPLRLPRPRLFWAIRFSPLVITLSNRINARERSLFAAR